MSNDIDIKREVISAIDDMIDSLPESQTSTIKILNDLKTHLLNRLHNIEENNTSDMPDEPLPNFKDVWTDHKF